mmetsp:Transcript_6018/g.17212  ORF Transcript_6018/g.17212 Transcript_6018/m.17212 type:complete len:286 (+) Transcript_6018:46-903(+)
MDRLLLLLISALAAAIVTSGDGGAEGPEATCSSESCADPGAAGESCCPSGSWPALRPPDDYQPRGTEDRIDDLPVYYVGTPGPKAVIVFPEVFGWAGRLKGICDTLADEGFFVVMPDCHRGDTAAGKSNTAQWIGQSPYSTVVGPDIKRLMDWLTAKGATSVGAMGFCWGVWALAKASASGVPLKCGVGAHPSTQLERLAFGGDELEMMRRVQMPILLMPAGNDPPGIQPGGDVAEAAVAKGGSVRDFPRMQHGWVSRGELSDPAVKTDVEAAMALAAAHLGSCV